MRTLNADKPVHATCVALDGRAVLILGKSGAGKSALGLNLMALGATLVSDDRVILTDETCVTASAPCAIKGLIEARGMGVLHAETVATSEVVLAVDLDLLETDRLPPLRHISILGHNIPLQHRIEGVHFAPAIVQYLRGERSQ